VSLHQGVDTSTPKGRPVFGMFASIAEFERQLLRSRVRSCPDASLTLQSRGVTRQEVLWATFDWYRSLL
jgi:hypothetical protein